MAAADFSGVATFPGPKTRSGRYIIPTPATPKQHEEIRIQRAVQNTVRSLIREYNQSPAETERRRQGRTEFVQPVRALLDDGREFMIVSRDISDSGIRLLASRSFLGQRLRIQILGLNSSEPREFMVRILWTCSAGDGLYENGGNFLEVVEKEVAPSPQPAA